MKLTKNEIQIFNELLGNDYIVVSQINGKCFALSENGSYYYNDCFEKTNEPFFMKQKYELLTPVKMIKFYGFYIMEPKEDIGVWYRGVLNSNGNYEFDCCADSIEEIVYSL